MVDISICVAVVFGIALCPLHVKSAVVVNELTFRPSFVQNVGLLVRFQSQFVAGQAVIPFAFATPCYRH